MLDPRQRSFEHFSSKIALKVRISDALMAPAFVLRVCNTATRCRDTILGYKRLVTVEEKAILFVSVTV
jgi:hypothetical protein